MKAFVTAISALAMMTMAAPAQAAAFDFDFSFEASNGDLYTGMAVVQADETGTSGGETSWSITDATGSVNLFAISGDEAVYSILGAPAFPGLQVFTLGQMGVSSAAFAFNTDSANGEALAIIGAAGIYGGAFGTTNVGPATLTIKASSVVTPTPGVPEPATWGLMLVGFGAAGAALRRRQGAGRLATV